MSTEKVQKLWTKFDGRVSGAVRQVARMKVVAGAELSCEEASEASWLAKDKMCERNLMVAWAELSGR